MNKLKHLLRMGVLTLILLSTSRPSAALCDSCVATAVGATGTAVTAAVVSLEGMLLLQLTNIGNAIASLNTANIAYLEKISEVNHQGLKAGARQSHELTSKVETLKIKRDINDNFGAISQGHCMETETTLGMLDSQTDAYQEAISNTKEFSSEIKANTKSPALRRKILREYLPEDTDFGDYFTANKTLAAEQMNHLPILAHVLSQSVVHPVAPEIDSPKENDRTRYYRELKRERDVHGVIAEDAIARSMLANAPVVAAGDYVTQTLEDAGIDAANYVVDEKTSESALIKAVGLSSFGSVDGVHNAALSGDELLRIVISEVGKSNFVLAKQYEALKDIRFLSALSFSKQAETFYNPKLERAYRGLN